MANVIARVGVYGDIHLSSKNYGAHRDYPSESLKYFRSITEITQNKQLTHLIGCGDFSFGRFHSKEYILEVEKELQKQFELVHGNRYELKGNHDEAGYGMTERDFYISKGLLKESTNLTIGNVNITMVDYGKHTEIQPNIIDNESSFNIMIVHDFFKFKDTQVANFGKAIELDSLTNWFGLDYMVCGHVHKIMEFTGNIIKDNMVHQLTVKYLGCMCRPAYREGYIDNHGEVLIFTIFDDGTLDVSIENVELLSIEESFNLEEKQKKAAKKEEKAQRVDITDVVKQLDTHDRNVGNPEDIINNMTDVDKKYKNKAIQLLKMALG